MMFTDVVKEDMAGIEVTEEDTDRKIGTSRDGKPAVATPD